jgi:hypothetical protein
VIRRASFVAVVRAFLIGCAVPLVLVGCAGVRSEAPNEQEKRGRAKATNEEQARSPEATASEEARCERTRIVHLDPGVVVGDDAALTNDVPGCPDGGPLSGTDEADNLTGGDGDDEMRGLGGADGLWGGFGRDVMHGGAGDDLLVGRDTFNEDGHDDGDDVLDGGDGTDELFGDSGKDVLRGRDGNDFLDGTSDGGDRDELYCGEGRRDQYAADKNDHVSGSCEVKAVFESM